MVWKLKKTFKKTQGSFFFPFYDAAFNSKISLKIAWMEEEL